jgi:hypothetical protein
VSIIGTLSDVNLALSNLTYVNNLNFNTQYGHTEEILIEVSDEGALGNDFGRDPPLRLIAVTLRKKSGRLMMLP